MKTIILILLVAVLMGCASASTQTQLTAQDYRDAMENGAIASTAVVGQTVCSSLNTTISECNELKSMMMQLSILSVREVSDAEVLNASKGKTYKDGMKAGAEVFNSSVGTSLCTALHLTGTRCSTMQTNIRNLSNEFIEQMDEGTINNLKETDKKKVRKQELIA